MTDKTCTIRKQFGAFYVSFGATRSKKEWKTIQGAMKYAASRGYKVEAVYTTPVVPLCCIPGTESYMSM